MGHGKCFGERSNHIKIEGRPTANRLSVAFTLIWVDDDQKKNPRLKFCLKQIDQQLIKFQDNDVCEMFVKERPDDHFILIISYKLGHILVPEIDDLPQVDSIFIYDFLSNDLYKSWMQQCQKVTLFM